MTKSAKSVLQKPTQKGNVSYDKYYSNLRDMYLDFESKNGLKSLNVHRNVDLNMIFHEIKMAKELRAEAFKGDNDQATSSQNIIDRHLEDQSQAFNTHYMSKIRQFIKSNNKNIFDTSLIIGPKSAYRANHFTNRQMSSNKRILESANTVAECQKYLNNIK